VSALANPAVGRYLNRHFVSAFQKVATFQVNRGAKQGGNVAGYFCTPERRVLHAVAGPVDADTFLREARWANETFQLAQLDVAAPGQLPTFFRKAHRDRLLQEMNVALAESRLPRPGAVTAQELDRLLIQNQHLGLGNQGKVHLVLAVGPTPRLEQLYRVVFERILGEKVSSNPVEVAGR
jgi:hypothetical protein